MMTPTVVSFAERKADCELAGKCKLPLFTKEFVDRGWSHVLSRQTSISIGVRYVDKISATKPADLPVEQPKSRFRYRPQSGQADRPDDSTECAGASG